MRIYCDCCGTTWEVYPTTLDTEGARECPCCSQKIDQAAWHKIKDAYLAVSQAHWKLIEQRNTNRGAFLVDFIDRSIYPNAKGA